MVKLSQSEKAYDSIIHTLSGIVIAVRLLQPEKVALPIPITLSGIVISVKPLQSEKALSPMLVTVFPSISDGISTVTASSLQPIILISPLSAIE